VIQLISNAISCWSGNKKHPGFVSPGVSICLKM